jgi:hypothetical protein
VRRQMSARANTLWQRDGWTGLQSWRRSTVGKALGHYRIANQLCASVETERGPRCRAKRGFQLPRKGRVEHRRHVTCLERVPACNADYVLQWSVGWPTRKSAISRFRARPPAGKIAASLKSSVDTLWFNPALAVDRL